jgi:ribosomal protein S18 acetylase RimI-like enzyme
MDIRQARPDEAAAICAIDRIARVEEERRRFIRRSVGEGIAFVAVSDDQVVGYAVLERSFFGRDFIAMLYVHPDHRRSGIGSALVRHVEGLCESERVFTSTNESNLPMQLLLQKLGYRRSGKVDDLDPGDPELIYSRELGG